MIGTIYPSGWRMQRGQASVVWSRPLIDSRFGYPAVEMTMPRPSRADEAGGLYQALNRKIREPRLFTRTRSLLVFESSARRALASTGPANQLPTHAKSLAPGLPPRWLTENWGDSWAGWVELARCDITLALTPAVWGMSTNIATRAVLSRTTGISWWCIGKLSETLWGWHCVPGRGLAMGLSLTLASIARTRAEAAFTMADIAIVELGGSGQRTAYRRRVGRCPAMCSAWRTITGRGMGGINRA